MKVILNETIESLGIIGSEVDVANGYARNYLLPQGKAMAATPQNRRKMKDQRKKIDLQIAKERKLAEEMAEQLKDVVCKISAKVSTENKLYGSITIRDIINTLDKQDIKVEKRMVLLKAPIKEVGSFKVPIRVYTEVEPEITVEIVPEEE
ncbi:MAG: 50S ribosomal protein L9 [Deltaproteobacteria bacterium]|nr:MAG: 50S ribosomal protein L9 [Deltaproteobacteria bacterium]RTZ98236.1 MAG: 50S ribosomal protein L9 [Deltaproteobacteria bacterium]